MKSVVLRGPVLTQSGYGVHSRQVARWLIDLAEAQKIKLAIQCVPWGDTTWYMNPDALDGLIGKIMKYSSGNQERGDVSFQVILPNEWDLSCGSYNVGITAGIETDRCNPDWIDSVNKMDCVVVPSSHIKNTFKNSGKLSTDIIVIPESFPDALFEEPTAEFEFDTPFNFLIFGQLTSPNPSDDRKNIFKTMKVLSDTFAQNDDVGIVIKSNVGRSTILDYKTIQGIITSACQQLKINKKIHLLHGTFTDKDLNNLYKTESIKATISLTRGEGFGLPILESAAAGVPVIATGWSAHTDYMKRDLYLRVKYDLQEVSQTRVDPNLFMKSAKWAEFREKSAVENLNNFYRYPNVYQKKAKELQESILETHNFESIAKNYSKTFGERLCLGT